MTTPADRPSIGLGYWLLTAAVVVATFAALEAVLRAGVVWRLPLGIVKAVGADRHLEAAWEIHQPPKLTPSVLVVGSSNIRVATELPRDGLARVLRAVTRQPVSVLSLCLSRASLDEYVILLEAAFERGHRPEVVVVGVWPGQVSGFRDYDPLSAERMPLSSSWLLSDVEPVRDPDTLWERYGPRLLAVERFQFAVNAWMRNRFHDLLHQRFQWDVGGQDAANDQELVPLLEDTRRLDMIGVIGEELTSDKAELSRMRLVLQLARSTGSRVIVLEAPWSPPVRQAFALVAGRYRTLMATLAREEGAVYVDPNEWLTLEEDKFADLFHVTPQGQQRYAAAIIPRLAAYLR